MMQFMTVPTANSVAERVSSPSHDIDDAGMGCRIEILRTRREVESLREFWSGCNPGRDADLDFYLFITDIYPEALTPHVVVLYDRGDPIALLAGRLDVGRVRVKAGYFALPVPRTRILSFVHGGCLGQISDATAKLLVSSIIETLAGGEADVARFEHLDMDSPLIHCIHTQPSWPCSDHIIHPEIHRIRSASKEAASFMACLSKKERYNQRNRAAKLSEDFRRVRIELFTGCDDVIRLMRDAESVARKSYQRGIGVGFSETPIIRSRLEFEATRGWLRAYILYLDGDPCAFWIGSLRNKVFLSDFLGFDPARAKYGPGLYLMMKVIEELFDNQPDGSRLAERIDFGIGDASYKERLSNSSRREQAIYIFAPRMTAVWLNFLRSSVGMMNRWARHLIAIVPWLGDLKRKWRVSVMQRE
ncbi:GNAT family N-acetyltransferase [Bradyrhizobium sp. 182]|uniref:GNAT family N-acetyltransferase n=1 Tax=unclassified Bradyrhizobium TaxID=2631580 RepID=UPI001FF838E5|nr:MULTISPECIES: GNAT family N-acetyltransferase [unclassified Bradyrhizobium]MCK1424834.1 GNAT family N-acetyltransferase [Bradyrhizobium sp. CW12]MCK1531864.1 GNAT family N-acetyltransferase [Bradyrhizobium sp. 182]MCK1646515.1 GNAT family N-acetyltransferase [Bradyrhizobium sp. 154]